MEKRMTDGCTADGLTLLIALLCLKGLTGGDGGRRRDDGADDMMSRVERLEDMVRSTDEKTNSILSLMQKIIKLIK